MRRTLTTLAAIVALVAIGCGDDGGGDTTGTGDAGSDATGTDTTEDTGSDDSGTDTTDDTGTDDTTEDTGTDDTTDDTGTDDTTDDTGTDDTGTDDTGTDDTGTDDGGNDDGGTDGPEPGKLTAVIGGGNKFGECLGSCKWDLVIEPQDGAVTLTVSDYVGGDVQTVQKGTLTTEGQGAMVQIALDLVGVELQEVYGCPDCADGGASWVSLRRNGEESMHEYDFSDAPPDLEAADDFVQGLIDDLLDCKMVGEMTPAEDCVPFD